MALPAGHDHRFRHDRTRKGSSALLVAFSIAVAFGACSQKEDPPLESGGAGASGGTAGTGTAGSSSGGTPAAGQGGSATSGGAGTSAAGTTSGTSGSGAGTIGGTAPQGGSASGASGASGSSSAGTPSTGGSGAGGAGGAGAAGGAGPGGTGGAPSGGVAPVISGGVRWIGRVDVSNEAAQKFAWSGTGFIGSVTGDTIAVRVQSEGGSDPIFFQPVIDGMLKPRVSVASSEGEKTLTLGSGLGAGAHVVELYRETEGKSNLATSTFLGFASGTPVTPPPYGGRLIEIVGDSISAGYGNLGSEQHPNSGEDPSGGCRFSTETESAYLTYGAVAARALGADASILAASGWGIYSDNGGSTSNVLPAVFANTVGGQASPAWSFTAQPQAVVINLGTNDFSADMNLSESSFSGAYKGFITTVRSKYPDALIMCAIGPMLYGTGLTNATAYINAMVTELNANGEQRVKVLNLGSQNASQGTGCDWHPNVAENQRMADLLVAELKNSLGW